MQEKNSHTSKARIVWHIAPRDRWCHLHPRLRIVPARFVDNDLFKWERGKNPWALFLICTEHLQHISLYVQNIYSNREWRKWSIIESCIFTLRHSCERENMEKDNVLTAIQICYFFLATLLLFQRCVLSNRFWVYIEITNLKASLLISFFLWPRLFSLTV